MNEFLLSINPFTKTYNNETKILSTIKLSFIIIMSAFFSFFYANQTALVFVPFLNSKTIVVLVEIVMFTIFGIILMIPSVPKFLKNSTKGYSDVYYRLCAISVVGSITAVAITSFTLWPMAIKVWSSIINEFSFNWMLIFVCIFFVICGIIFPITAINLWLFILNDSSSGTLKKCLYAIFMTPFIIALFSVVITIGVVGLGGNEAKHKHLTVSIDELQNTFERSVLFRAAEKKLLTKFERNQTYYKHMAYRENAGDLFSKIPGSGPMFDILQGFAKTVNNLDTILKEGWYGNIAKETEELSLNIKLIRDELRAIHPSQLTCQQAESLTKATNELYQRNYDFINTQRYHKAQFYLDVLKSKIDLGEGSEDFQDIIVYIKDYDDIIKFPEDKKQKLEDIIKYLKEHKEVINYLRNDFKQIVLDSFTKVKNLKPEKTFFHDTFYWEDVLNYAKDLQDVWFIFIILYALPFVLVLLRLFYGDTLIRN